MLRKVEMGFPECLYLILMNKNGKLIRGGAVYHILLVDWSTTGVLLDTMLSPHSRATINPSN